MLAVQRGKDRKIKIAFFYFLMHCDNQIYFKFFTMLFCLLQIYIYKIYKKAF